jgi:serine/threonine protein phosphatase PrpC
MRFTIFQDSRKGSRKVNQDRLAYTYGRDTLLLVVADGMGGHAAGEVASRMALSALVSLALEVPDWIFKVDEAHAREIERRSRTRGIKPKGNCSMASRAIPPVGAR